jgi:hypothetical protein
MPIPTKESFLTTLDTPVKIQNYLESIPFNHEEEGETCRSAHEALRHRKAHCLEGAFIACAALKLQGKRPIIVSLKVREDDYDHVVTIYKKGKHFGAMSKTNHAVLGWRDPVYRSIRELVMSYFHEYFLTKNGEKTLRGYSRPINLNRFGTSWITSREPQFPIGIAIARQKHIPLLPRSYVDILRKATPLERASASIAWESIKP